MTTSKLLRVSMSLFLFFWIGTATGTSIPKKRLNKVYENHFKDINSPVVKEINVDGLSYYFISVSVTDYFNNMRLTKKRLRLHAKKHLFKFLKKKSENLYSVKMKHFISNMQWQNGKRFFILAYVLIKNISINNPKEHSAHKKIKPLDRKEQTETISDLSINNDIQDDIKKLNTYIEKHPNSIPAYHEINKLYKSIGNIDKVNDITDRILDLEFNKQP